MPTSDDFKTGLDTSTLWTTSNTPTGTSITADDDGTDWYVEIATTDSNDHDHYSTLANTPYILQSLGSEDFDIRTKCLTTPNQQYEGFGFLLKGSSDTQYVRIDFNYNGSSYFVWASETNGANMYNRINVGSLAFYPYLRITRISGALRIYTSSDGTNWDARGADFSVTHFTPEYIGLVTNSSVNSNGFAAQFDFFEDYTNDPISGEDSGGGAGTITGTGAISAPAPTLSGSGTLARDGTGAVTLPVATLSGSGLREITGTGAATLPAVTASGSGTVGAVVTGTGAATLPVASLAGAGLREITGTGAATLPAVTAAGSGLREVVGSGGVTAPVPTLDGSGTLAGSVTGTGAASLPAVTASGAGLREITGSGGVTSPVPTIDGSGELSGIVGGSGGVTAPIVTLAGAGTIARDGTGAVSAPVPALAGTGSVEELQPGTGAVTLPLPSLSGAGVRTSKGTGAATLPSVTLVGTGIRASVGSGAITLPLVTLYGVQVVGGIRVERVGGDLPGGTLSASANNGTLTLSREAG